MANNLSYHATATCDDCGTVETYREDVTDLTPERFAVHVQEHFDALGWVDSFRTLCPKCREAAKLRGYAAAK